MEAGALDRRLQLLQPIATKDAANEEVLTWVFHSEVAAKQILLGDAERLRAQQLGATISARYRIRWSRSAAQMDARWQLQCDGRRYAVAGAIVEIGRREGLEITAAAVADEATS